VETFPNVRLTGLPILTAQNIKTSVDNVGVSNLTVAEKTAKNFRGLLFALLCTYNLHYNFGRSPTVEKFNSQLIFHNSNTGLQKLNTWIFINS